MTKVDGIREMDMLHTPQVGFRIDLAGSSREREKPGKKKNQKERSWTVGLDPSYAENQWMNLAAFDPPRSVRFLICPESQLSKITFDKP